MLFCFFLTSKNIRSFLNRNGIDKVGLSLILSNSGIAFSFFSLWWSVMIDSSVLSLEFEECSLTPKTYISTMKQNYITYYQMRIENKVRKKLPQLHTRCVIGVIRILITLFRFINRLTRFFHLYFCLANL